MDVNAAIQISDEDAPGLAVAMGCMPANVPAVLAAHARAALNEYVEMYLGRRALSRGTEILEHRLSLLITLGLDNRIPSADEVSRLFRLTSSQSRTLIRNTFAKYPEALTKALLGTAKSVLEAAHWRNQANLYGIESSSANLIEFLNQRLTVIAGDQQPIARTKDTLTSYDVAPGSYDPLCEMCGADPVPRP